LTDQGAEFLASYFLVKSYNVLGVSTS